MTRAILSLACIFAGCRENTPNAVGPNGVFKSAGEHDTTQRVYKIDGPDVINFTSPNVKEIDGQKLTVDYNGNISFTVLGQVHVAGLSPDEVRDKLVELSSKYYVQPIIRVEVTDNSKFFYVFGFSGTKQGKYPYSGRVTVLNALADAGFNPSAWPTQVRISRPGRDQNANATVVVDFTKMWDYGDLTQNYLLEEGDIVFIPLTPLAAWNIGAGQLLAPFATTLSLVSTTSQANRAINGNNP